MVTRAEREHRQASHKFRELMDSGATHLRVGQGRGDQTRVTFIGMAHELHGLDGCCTCCPRRPAGEPSSREVAIAAARRAAADSAELGPRFGRPAFAGDAELL